MLCDGNIDVFFYIVGYLFGFIKEVIILCDSVLVNVENDVIEKLIVDNFYYCEVIIFGGMYCGSDEDVIIFGVVVMFVFFIDVVDDVVYEVVKVVFENFDSFKCLYLVFVNLKKEEMVVDVLSVFLYLGVVKYYKEVGLID